MLYIFSSSPLTLSVNHEALILVLQSVIPFLRMPLVQWMEPTLLALVQLRSSEQ